MEERAPGSFPPQAREPSPGGGVQGKAGVPHHPSGISLLLALLLGKTATLSLSPGVAASVYGQMPGLATSRRSASRVRRPPLFSAGCEGFTQAFGPAATNARHPKKLRHNNTADLR